MNIPTAMKSAFEKRHTFDKGRKLNQRLQIGPVKLGFVEEDGFGANAES